MKNVLQELIDFEKPGEKVRMIIRTDSESVAAESVTVQRVATGTREALPGGPLWLTVSTRRTTPRTLARRCGRWGDETLHEPAFQDDE